MKIFKSKVAGVGLPDLAVATLTKYFEERALAPMIGNGTFWSGAIKMGVGMFLSGQKNRWIKAAGLGFAMDGGEDILQGVLGGGNPLQQVIGGQGASNSAVAVV